MKKIALYCRVSSDDQKERETIDNQIEILHTFIEMKDELEIYDEFLDNGISGTIPFEQRPEGKRLINDASKHLFDAVLVWKVDRFGRDTLSGLTAVEMLRKYDIEILSVTEPFDLNTPTGRFQFITYLNMAELERNNILDRTFIGATRAAKKGKWLGGIVPYGYSINKEGFLEINEVEADVIKKIFKLYTEDKLSTVSIAVYLNNAGIPSSCGSGKGKRTKGITNMWRAGSIQRILSNTTYKGIHYYGKRATRRKELIERVVPAIVDNETWEKAQEVKKRNFITSKRNTKKEYLLRGLIYCQYCGKRFYGINYKDKGNYYVCAGKRYENIKIFEKRCDNINIKTSDIEPRIWADCVDILKNYDSYIKGLKARQNNETDNPGIEITELAKALEEKKVERNNILTLFRKGIITEDDVEKQIKEIGAEESKISSLLEIAQNKANYFKHQNELIETMSAKLKSYYNKLDELTFDDKYDIVKLLVKRIEVGWIIEDGQKGPDIHTIYNLVKLDNCTDMDSWMQQA